MKTVLEEAQVRAALAAIAGTEPGGICIIATEMKASDAAVGAAFGAIGAAVAAAGRPNYHIIPPHRGRLLLCACICEKIAVYPCACGKLLYSAHGHCEI